MTQNLTVTVIVLAAVILGISAMHELAPTDNGYPACATILLVLALLVIWIVSG